MIKYNTDATACNKINIYNYNIFIWLCSDKCAVIYKLYVGTSHFIAERNNKQYELKIDSI